MVGYIVCMATQNGIARYIVSYIYVVGLFGANPLIQTWISGTLSKSPEQKATSIAINNILGQAGNVMAPYFFIASDEPKYQSGACGGSTRSCCVMLWSMVRRTTLIFSERRSFQWLETIWLGKHCRYSVLLHPATQNQ
jgi:hypothetical protein